MAKKLDFDASIDEDCLDREWLRQPTLYFTWARRLADATKNVELAKAALDLAKAEADAYARRHPKQNLGKDKPTEGAIESFVIRDADCQAALAAYVDAKHRADILRAAVAALDHRKRALENLVELNVREYFSTPRASPDAKNKMEERGKKKIHGVRKRSKEED